MNREITETNYHDASIKAREKRNFIERQREHLREKNNKLLEQEIRLPKITQNELRVGSLSGLMGRKDRQVFEGQRTNILKKKNEVGFLSKELRRFEKEEVEPFEKEIKDFKDFWGF